MKPFIVEKNTPHGRHSISCLTPGRCMLFIFPWFQCTEGKRSSCFHPLPPAPWMGACRISEGILPVGCFYRDSHGEGGRRISPGRVYARNRFSSCWYMVKGAREEVTLVPWGVFLTKNAPARPSYNGGRPPYSSILSLFLTIPHIGYANFAKSTLFMELHLFC